MRPKKQSRRKDTVLVHQLLSLDRLNSMNGRIGAIRIGFMPRLMGAPHFPSSSASRFTAGAAGFLNLNQIAGGPKTYREPSRFDTAPSKEARDINSKPGLFCAHRPGG